MKSRLRYLLPILLFCFGLSLTASAAVVVEEAGQGSALETAGLRPGDRLLAWSRPPAPPANPGEGQGEIRTVFDWLWVTREQAPRGTVRLSGERDGAAILFEVPKGLWETRVRPEMAAESLRSMKKDGSGSRRAAGPDRVAVSRGR